MREQPPRLFSNSERRQAVLATRSNHHFPGYCVSIVMALTYLDWFIVIVLGVGLIRGLTVGAIRQVVSLAGLLLAFLLGIQLMEPVGALTAQSLDLSASAAPIVGFVVVFGAVQLIAIALIRMFEAAIDTLNLSLANRAAGGAIGAFKAALLLSVLFLVSTRAGIPDEEMQVASTLYAPVAAVLPSTYDYTAGLLPQVRDVSDRFGDRVRPVLEDEAPPSPPESTPDEPAAPDSSAEQPTGQPLEAG